jgi:hypothetical protein
MLGSSLVVAQLAASQEGLSSMKLVITCIENLGIYLNREGERHEMEQTVKPEPVLGLFNVRAGLEENV